MPGSRKLSDRDPRRATSPVAPARIAAAVVALAVLPIVVATIRAVAGHWVPLGDDAYFSIRAADVWSIAHFPLLGTWTSASLTLGRNVNNPGPALFDLLAAPVWCLGSASGVAVGVGLLNCVAVVGAGLVAYRRAGLTLLVPAMAVTTGLVWAMGSELLFDPWQPHSMLLPFLWFLFLVWGMADGDLALVPWSVAVASLLVQTHLTYAYLVPTLAVIGVLGLVWRLRRLVHADRERAPALRRRIAIVGTVSVLVLAVCWFQPVLDEVAGDGNLTALLETGGGASSATLGPTRAARVTASVLSIPPFWLRPSFETTLAPAATPTSGPGGVGLARLPSSGTALASLALLGALLAGSAVVARRRRDSAGLTLVLVAAVGLVAGSITATRIPIELFGAAAHQFRYLWPLGAFSVFAIVAPLARLSAGVSVRGLDRGVAVTGAALVVLLSMLALPFSNAGVGPAMQLWAEPVVRDLDAQMAARPPKGPLLMDFSNIAFLEPYSTPLLAQLQRSDVEFVTDQPGQVRQLGRGRRFDGRNARARILYRLGDAATVTPPGWQRIAFHPGLDRADRRALAELEVSGVSSPRRRDLERQWARATIGVFIAPLPGHSAAPGP